MAARVICISRAIWTGAETIASDIAKELDFRCVDEEIIQMAAERRNLNPAEVASAERRKPFLRQLLEDVARTKGSELVNYLPNQRLVPVGNEDIRALIREAIRDTAQQGKVVIVAHAASYALGGRDDVLRVLVTGSPFKRASRSSSVKSRRSLDLRKRYDS